VAQKTRCLTNGAVFHTAISSKKVSISVDLPFNLDIDESEADILTRLLHNQLETILRFYWR
jgi:hypothetical protein